MSAMSKDFPPLNALRSFAETARLLSFSQAADRLNVTAGAVSRMVRKLEDHLGLRLLDRSPQGVKLTPHGEAYFRDVSGPLAAITAATRRLVAARNPKRIVVACYPTFAARWLLPRWSRFFDRHPDIEVQIATSLLDVDFEQNDEIDIAIQLGTDGDLDRRLPGLLQERLLDIEIVAVAAPARFAKCRTEADRARVLAKQVLIHSKPLPGEWPQWLAAMIGATRDSEVARLLGEIDASRGPDFETLSLSYQAAAEGIGVAIGIHAFVRDEIAEGVLVCPFAFRRRSGRHFHLVSRTGNANARAVRLYRQWLMEEAKRDAL
jgi:DNA-binding transcriptional LysR family regulator